MNKFTSAIVSVLVCSIVCARPAAAQSSGKLPDAPAAKTQSPAPTQDSPFKDLRQKASYALGMNVGSSLRRQSVDLDPDLLAKGLKDSLSGGKTLMTDEEAVAALRELQTEMRAKAEAKKAEEGATNQKEGDAFLAANKTKEGVVTLPSGLQYKVLSQGTGPKPTASDTVTCNYKGTLINGTEFDSSYKRGEPTSFEVGRVIKGWTEALQLMPVGSKWQLFIPPTLAYAEHGAGADIGPNATLIFEVELLSIQSKDNPAKENAPGK